MTDSGNPAGDEDLALLDELICERTGISFPEQRRYLLHARLQSRMSELRLATLRDYYLALRFGDPAEFDYLVSKIRNGETYFQRESGQVAAVFEEGLARIKAKLGPIPELRVLSMGCASGEEPYSIAMYASSCRQELGQSKLQIDACDIDSGALARARQGIYGKASLRSVSQACVARHFEPAGGERFSVRAPYREGVRFYRGNLHELQKFVPGKRYHVIFCRNVLIYFSPGARRDALRSLGERLEDGGLLLLGMTESAGHHRVGLRRVKIGDCLAYERAD